MKIISWVVTTVLVVLGTAQLATANTEDEDRDAARFAAALKHVDELIEIEKLEEAVGFLKELDARTTDDNAKVGFRLGRIFLQLDRPAKALDHFEDAAFSTMDDGEIYVGLAQANLALGNLTRARSHAQTALRTDKDLIAAHVVIASVDDRSGQVTAAKGRFVDLIKIRPDSEPVITAYALFLSHRSDPDAAIDVLTPFLDRFPYAAEASDLLGLLHWAQGRRREAFKYRLIAAKAFKSKGNEYRAEQIITWLMANNRGGVFQDGDGPQVKKEAPQEAPRSDCGPQPSSPPIQAKSLRRPDPLPFGQCVAVSTGSGFIVGGGKFVITNRHVIDGIGKLAVRSGTGEVRLAQVRSVAEDDDLAILELQEAYPESYSISLETFEDPRPGKSAVVMGFPLAGLLGWQRPSLTEGIVSKDSGMRDNPATFLITSKMNKGNSGGPIFDGNGNLIGVAVAKLSTTNIYEEKGHLPEDVNIGIKASRVLDFLKQPINRSGGGSPISLEDLYQIMLAKVVLVVGEKK
jgi:S1-C subfamily serine protease